MLKEEGRKVNIPVAIGYTVIRPEEDEEVMEENKQKLFRSGVGTLLYSIKLLVPMTHV